MSRRLAALLLLVAMPAASLAAEAGRTGAATGGGETPSADAEPPVEAFDATNPEAVLAAMQDYGIRAVLGRTENGNPVIDSRVARSNFSIIFYGCTRDRDCAQALFTTSWSSEGRDAAIEVANTWNTEKILGRAWVDEDGDYIGLDHTVVLRKLTREAMDETLTAWGDIVEEYAGFIYDKLWNGEEPDSYNASSRDI